MNLQPVILSGGAGTRLWPLSREHYPKQFLPLAGDETLLQETVRRVRPADGPLSDIDAAEPVVVCNEEHRFLVAEQLRQIDVVPAGIILEPVGRNTAPALTVAALHAVKEGGDAVLFVMPADHVIKDVATLHQAIETGYRLAEQDHFVTFGIVPTAPETGYGYIQRGEPLNDVSPHTSLLTPHALARFAEKPDAATAACYVENGQYYWNSGMFMMKASNWLAAIEHFNPEMAAACRHAYESGQADSDFYRLDTEAFTFSPSDSIDYAVMERLGQKGAGAQWRGAVVPLNAGWSDVGAWGALWEVADKDEYGNVVRGDALVHDTRNTMLLADGRLVASVGVDDLVIVETADAVLVAHKNAAQDVKTIVSRLKGDGRPEHINHRCVHRPWGTYETIDIGDRYQVKRITVHPGAALSLQMHHHRAEHWVVVTGTARVTRGEEVFLVAENESTYIPLGTKHRLENPGKFPLEMVEVQSGSYLGEDDIVRFDDIYNR